MQTPPLVPGQQKQAPIKEKAIEYAKGAQEFVKSVADKLPELKTYEQNLINILGEEVAFAPTGINKSFKQIVEFDDYYKPAGISDDDFIILKNTMRILFENRYRKILDVETGDEEEGIYVLEHFPPCDEHEKELVLKSLIHRKNLLLGQLKQLGIKSYEEIRQELRLITEKDRELQGKESLTSRQYLLHYYHLQKFIDAYNTYAKCVSTDEKAYKGVKIDLDDDKIRELLKQYVFFILQGKNPLEDFKKTDPTSSQFIARLAKKPLGEKFPTFMDKYKKEQFPIPEPIAKILDSTELSPGAMKAAVDQQIIVRIKEIVKFINNLIPPNHPFRKRFPDLDKVTDLKAVLDELWKLLRDCEENQKTLQTQLLKQKQDLENRIKTCEQSKAALEIQKRKYDQEIRNLKAILSFHTNQEAKIVDLNNQITALEETVKQRDEQINKLNEDIANLRQQQTLLQTRIDELTRQNADLTQQVRDGEGRITQLTQDVGTRDNTITQLRQDVGTRDNTITQLRQDIGTRDNTITQLTQEGQTLRQELDQLRQNTTKNTTIADLRRQVEELQRVHATEIEALQKQLDDARNKIATSEAAQKAAQETAQKARDEFTRQQTELNATRAQLEEEKKKATQCEKDKAELERKVSEANAKVQKLQEDLIKATQESQQVRSQLTQGEQSATGLQQEITKLNQQLQQATTSLDELREEKETLLAKLGSLQTNNTDLANRLKVCENEEKRLKDKLQKTSETAIQLETKLKAVDSEGAAARQEAERLKTELDRMKIAINDMKDQYDAAIGERNKRIQILETNLQEKTNAYDKLKEEADLAKQEAIRTKADAEAAKKIAQETISKISQEKQSTSSESQAKLIELQEQLVGIKIRVNKAESDAQEANTRAANLTKSLQEAEQKLQQAIAAYNQEKTRADQAETLAGEEKTRADQAEAQQQDLMTKMNTIKQERDQALQNAQIASQAATKAQEEKRKCDDKLRQLQQQLQQKNKLVSNSEEGRKVLEEDKAKLKKEIETLQVRLMNDDANVRAANKRAEEANARLQQMQTQLDTLTASYEQMQKERNNALITADQSGKQRNAALVERDNALASAKRMGEERNKALKSADQLGQERSAAITRADELALELAETKASAEQTTKERDEALASAEQAGKERNDFKTAAENFEAQLAQTTKERNDAIQSAEEIRKINEDYDEMKKLIREIAESEDPITQEIKIEGDQAPIKKIIDRLHVAAISTSVTKQIQERQTITSMQCYYIFLLTFLWRTNFPRLILPSAVKDNYYNWENTTYNMFESVFNKAPNPTLISVAASSSTEQKTQEDRSYILGLYKTYKKSREIMSEYLRIFRILEMNLQYAVYKPSDFDPKQPIELPDNKYIQYVKDLIEKINFISNSYKQAKKLLKRPTGSFQQRVNSFLTELNADQDTFLLTDSTSMAESATDYMIAHQPDIDKNIFKYTILVENDTIKIGTTGNLNYAVLFYLFLFVSRDYFNLIENSGLCQLPRFLKTQ